MDYMVGKPRYHRIIYCPFCADRPYVEKVCTVWMDRPFRHRKYWTQEEDDIILDGKRLGYTESRIAESLPERTRSAVNNRWGHIQAKKKKEEA